MRAGADARWPRAVGLARAQVSKPGGAHRRAATLVATTRGAGRTRRPGWAGAPDRRSACARCRRPPIVAGRGQARCGVVPSAHRGGRGCRARWGVGDEGDDTYRAAPVGTHERENFVVGCRRRGNREGGDGTAMGRGELGQHTEVAVAVDPRRRHQRGEAVEQFPVRGTFVEEFYIFTRPPLFTTN